MLSIQLIVGGVHIHKMPQLGIWVSPRRASLLRAVAELHRNLDPNRPRPPDRGAITDSGSRPRSRRFPGGLLRSLQPCGHFPVASHRDQMNAVKGMRPTDLTDEITGKISTPALRSQASFAPVARHYGAVIEPCPPRRGQGSREC
jgi:hypothetical protein